MEKLGNKSVEQGYVFVPYIMLQTPVQIDEPESIKLAKKRVVSINRERQIEAILDDKEFVEYKLEETDEYKKLYKKISVRYALADGKRYI